MSSNSGPGVEGFGYRQELKRSLGLGDLLIYGLIFIGVIAPAPVFGIVFAASGGMVPLTYALGLVAMLFTAFSYMSMARVFPVAGSVYAYTSRSIGETVGFFAGWAILLDYLLLPTLCNVVCAIALHAVLPIVPQWLCVVVLLILTTTVNYLGIETTARANILLLVVQVLILLCFLGAGLVAAANGVGGAHLSSLPFYNPATFSPSVLFGAASLGVLSFLGFDAISTLAEEAKDGAAGIARATIVSLLVAGAIFVGMTYLASLFLLGQTGFANADAANSAFYDISGTIGGSWLRFVVTVPGVIVGATAGALAAQAATARLIYSMARDGKLPRPLAHVHPVRKVPERAVFLVAAINLVLSLALVSSLELLTSMVCFGALLGFVLVNLSVIAHFRRRPERSWLAHVVSPAIGALITAAVLWNGDRNAKLAGLAWLAVGGLYFLALRWLGRSTAMKEV
jgi:amino acid transporter